MWLLGSFAVFSLYRADTSATRATTVTEVSAEQAPASAAVAPSSSEAQQPGAGQLAAVAGLSASYARALITQFQAQP